MVYVGDHAGINKVIDDVKQVDILISKKPGAANIIPCI